MTQSFHAGLDRREPPCIFLSRGMEKLSSPLLFGIHVRGIEVRVPLGGTLGSGEDHFINEAALLACPCCLGQLLSHQWCREGGEQAEPFACAGFLKHLSHGEIKI